MNKPAYEEEIHRLNVILEIKDSRINSLNLKIQELENYQKYIIQKEKSLEYRENRLRNDSEFFEKRKQMATYYEALLDIFKKYPSLQGEWINLMTTIKLVCDTEDIKGLI